MLKAVAALLATGLLLAVVLVAALAGRADGRADIQNYLKGPGLFYPARHDVNGTAIKLNIDLLGWNTTRIAGNLGIGNGSVRTFDQTHTYDVEYPAEGFMCGDVSTQPWIPGLKTQPPRVEAAAEEEAVGSEAGHEVPGENVAGTETGLYPVPEANATSPEARGQYALSGLNAASPGLSGNADRYAFRYAARNETGITENSASNRTGESAKNETKPYAPSREQIAAMNEDQTYAAYHPIQYLSPVKDILYEHPLSTSGCAYTTLLGFETPAGDLVNVAMKSTTFGY